MTGMYKVRQSKIIRDLQRFKWKCTHVPLLDGLIGPTNVTLTTGASTG